MSKNFQLTLGQRLILGAISCGFGIFPALATFDIGPLGTSDINGPAWMGLAAGGVFILAGLALMAQGTVLASVFALMILISFAAMGTWIGFGAGERVCGVSFGDLFDNPMLDVSGLLCRIPFGYGAMMINALIFLIVADKLLKTAEGAITKFIFQLAKVFAVLVFLPLLLFLIVPMFFRALPDLIKEMRKTGKLPKRKDKETRQKELEDALNLKLGKKKLENNE